MRQTVMKQYDLPVTQDQAFQYFTTEEKLVQWLCNAASVDALEGGRYELFWDLENPHKDSTQGCVILAYEEPYFLSFNWRGPEELDQVMNHVDPLTLVSVFFLPLDASRTRVLLQHSGFGSSADWDTARLFFERIWDKALFKLVRSFDLP